MVNTYVKPIVLGIASFVLGIVVTRYYDSRRITPPHVEPGKPATQNAAVVAENKNAVDYETLDYTHEPLWAYGFDAPRAPREKALPQNPPNKDLRTDDDPAR